MHRLPALRRSSGELDELLGHRLGAFRRHSLGADGEDWPAVTDHGVVPLDLVGAEAVAAEAEAEGRQKPARVGSSPAGTAELRSGRPSAAPPKIRTESVLYACDMKLAGKRLSRPGQTERKGDWKERCNTES